MSIIKSTNEDLILNADGSGKEVKIQRDGTQVLATTSTGIDVTGNVSVSGTVDGRDIAADGATLDDFVASSKVKDWHVSGMKVLTSNIIIDPACLVGSETQTGYGDQSGDMGQPNVWDDNIGYYVPAASIRKNIFEAAGATTSSFVQPSVGHDMYTNTPNSNGCSIDMDLVSLGMNLGNGRSNKFPNYKFNDEGRIPYLVMRIAIDGSNHSHNPTVIAFGSPHNGNYNGGWHYQNAAGINGTRGGVICGKIDGRQWVDHTSAQLQADSSLTDHGCFTIHSAGYGFTTHSGGNYGTWVAIPLNDQHYRGNTNRLWNVGFKRLAIGAYGIAWSKPFTQAEM